MAYGLKACSCHPLSHGFQVILNVWVLRNKKAYHKAKRTKSDVDWDAYRILNNQFTYAKKAGLWFPLGSQICQKWQS